MRASTIISFLLPALCSASNPGVNFAGYEVTPFGVDGVSFDEMAFPDEVEALLGLAQISRLSQRELPQLSSLLGVEKCSQSAVADDLVDGLCGDVVIIFARGTWQKGNIGCVLGPELIKAVRDAVGEKTVIAQGVSPYLAVPSEYTIGGSPEGIESVVRLTARAAEQCPEAKIVLVGYSQGAQITRRAVQKLPQTLYPRISAIVLMGDPDHNKPYPNNLTSKQLSCCKKNPKDFLCHGILWPMKGHRMYHEDVGEMAGFIAAAIEDRGGEFIGCNCTTGVELDARREEKKRNGGFWKKVWRRVKAFFRGGKWKNE